MNYDVIESLIGKKELREWRIISKVNRTFKTEP